MFNSGGINDVINDNKMGLIINKLNTKKIAEKIMLLLEDCALREEISQNAKKEISENYRWERCFEKIYKIYRNYAKHGGK